LALARAYPSRQQAVDLVIGAAYPLLRTKAGVTLTVGALYVRTWRKRTDGLFLGGLLLTHTGHRAHNQKRK
jgi:hypothetical protein